MTRLHSSGSFKGQWYPTILRPCLPTNKPSRTGSTACSLTLLTMFDRWVGINCKPPEVELPKLSSAVNLGREQRLGRLHLHSSENTEAPRMADGLRTKERRLK